MAVVIRNHVLILTILFLVSAEFRKSFDSSSFNYQGNSHHRRQHHNQSNYHLTLSVPSNVVFSVTLSTCGS